VFGAPAVVGTRAEPSGAFRVGKNEIKEANDAWDAMGLGRPFPADGKPVLDRNQKKQAMKAINERRVDQGLPRFVNLDGGYGDET
jgi:hypothetical protein